MNLSKSFLLSGLLIAASTAAFAKNEWTNYMGNPAHTGYLAQTTNPEKYKVLWTTQIDTDKDMPIHPVISDNTVYFNAISESDQCCFPWKATLFALNLDTGKVVWQKQPESNFLFSDAIIHNGNVLVTLWHLNMSGLRIDYSLLGAYDAATGELKEKTHVTNRVPGAPAAFADSIYLLADYPRLDDNEQGYLESHDAKGKINWAQPAVGDSQYLTIGNKYLLSPAGESLEVFNRASGLKEFDLKWQEGQTATQNLYLPTLDEANDTAYYFNSPNIFAFDLKTHAMKWMLPIGHANILGAGNIATANGEVYVVANNYRQNKSSPDTLVNIDRESGKIKWSWHPEAPEKLESGNFSLVATTDMLFVSGKEFTYAVSVKTHQAVWKIKKVGELALGKDRLLISNNEEITAVALN